MNGRAGWIAIATAMVLWGCGTQSGVDEHGNAFTARIQVVDSTGLPRPGIPVQVLPSEWTPGDSLDTLSTGRQGGGAWTDSGGWARIDRLASGIRVALAGDSAHAGLLPFAVGSDGAGVLVHLSRVGAVSGSLRGARQGTPVRIPGTRLEARTDSAGGFVLVSVPTGVLRLTAGFPGARTVLRDVLVEPGRLTRLDRVDFDSTTSGETVPGQTLSDEVPVPLVDPPGGTYRSPVAIRARSVFPTDSLVVSRDGSAWEPWSGQVLGSDACLLLKSLRSGARSAPVRTECYVISP